MTQPHLFYWQHELAACQEMLNIRNTSLSLPIKTAFTLSLLSMACASSAYAATEDLEDQLPDSPVIQVQLNTPELTGIQKRAVWNSSGDVLGSVDANIIEFGGAIVNDAGIREADTLVKTQPAQANQKPNLALVNTGVKADQADQALAVIELGDALTQQTQTTTVTSQTVWDVYTPLNLSNINLLTHPSWNRTPQPLDTQTQEVVPPNNNQSLVPVSNTPVVAMAAQTEDSVELRPRKIGKSVSSPSAPSTASVVQSQPVLVQPAQSVASAPVLSQVMPANDAPPVSSEKSLAPQELISAVPGQDALYGQAQLNVSPEAALYQRLEREMAQAQQMPGMEMAPRKLAHRRTKVRGYW